MYALIPKMSEDTKVCDSCRKTLSSFHASFIDLGETSVINRKQSIISILIKKMKKKIVLSYENF